MKRSDGRRTKPAALKAALELVRAWGSEGGKKRWKGLTAEQRGEIARRAAEARWRKPKGKTHRL